MMEPKMTRLSAQMDFSWGLFLSSPSICCSSSSFCLPLPLPLLLLLLSASIRRRLRRPSSVCAGQRAGERNQIASACYLFVFPLILSNSWLLERKHLVGEAERMASWQRSAAFVLRLATLSSSSSTNNKSNNNNNNNRERGKEAQKT